MTSPTMDALDVIRKRAETRAQTFDNEDRGPIGRLRIRRVHISHEPCGRRVLCSRRRLLQDGDQNEQAKAACRQKARQSSFLPHRTG